MQSKKEIFVKSNTKIEKSSFNIVSYFGVNDILLEVLINLAYEETNILNEKKHDAKNADLLYNNS